MQIKLVVVVVVVVGSAVPGPVAVFPTFEAFESFVRIFNNYSTKARWISSDR